MSSLVISLDFEMFWGVAESRTIDGYRRNIEGEWEAIPGVLKLFQHYGVRATWATVGMLMCRDYSHWREIHPSVLPRYDRAQCSTYALDSVVRDNPKLFFARPLVEQILMTDGQELASHTYSHFFCAEPGVDVVQFDADCICQKAIFSEYGLVPTSLVFPRNQVKKEFLTVAAENGITAYRGNQNHWLYRNGHFTPYGILGRAVRKADGYFALSGNHVSDSEKTSVSDKPIDIPASLFLRPSEDIPFLDSLHLNRVRRGMQEAAIAGGVFHLWWHPHNFGTNIQRNLDNLESLLQFYVLLADKYGMSSLSMAGAVAADVFSPHSAGVPA